MPVSKVGGGIGRGALESMVAANGGNFENDGADDDSDDREVFVILDEIDVIWG